VRPTFFPPIILYNPFYLGDSVLLEGVAMAMQSPFMSEVYIASSYPELFIGHPFVKGIALNEIIDGARRVDLTDAIRGIDNVGGGQNVRVDKLEQIYEASGLNKQSIRKPDLYLTKEEYELSERLREQSTGKRIGLVPESRHGTKNWGDNFSYLINELKDNALFVFSENELQDNYKFFDNCIVNKIYGRPIRELMVWLKSMDLVIGVDTGPMHIAGALDIPIVVIGYPHFRCLYEPYLYKEYISPKEKKPLFTASALQAMKSVKKYKKPYKNSIALMMLEGLGGTITVSDHAQKVCEKYGEKIDLIVRKYEELFYDNPYINDVIMVGMKAYPEATREWTAKYKRLGVIKTGLGKWYGIKQVFGQWQELYDHMPLGTNSLEKYGLNMTQIANMTLGLPYESIESKIYYYEDYETELPERYVIFSNGVDTWHKGLHQTKCWANTNWRKLLWMSDISFIQVGTQYDEYIEGALDLRGQTNIPQLNGLLKNATAIVTTEGGLMHLAYAVGNQNTIVLRGPTRGNFFCYPDQIKIDSPVCTYCYWDTGEWYKDCPKHIDNICMRMITPERVATALRGLVNEPMVKMPCVA
jgi:ADP-heptose:LPS heptosyltransferase